MSVIYVEKLNVDYSQNVYASINNTIHLYYDVCHKFLFYNRVKGISNLNVYLLL